MFHRRLPQPLLSYALLAVAGGSAGCGSTPDSTTGKRVTLHTAMTADPATTTTFTTGFGWDVTLEKAAVAVEALYYFDGPPPTALFEVPKPAWSERLAALLIGTAWAHPGHYQAGTALGQVLLPEPRALDLFEPPTDLPDGDGVTGIYRSARFVLPATAPEDAVLEGHLAIAQGTATNHDGTTGQPIHFELVADYDDISMSVNEGAVDGCVLDETNVTSDGTVTLDVEPSIWLNLVDFSKLDPGTDATPTEARDAGFSQGVTQLSAYHFSYAR